MTRVFIKRGNLDSEIRAHMPCCYRKDWEKVNNILLWNGPPPFVLGVGPDLLGLPSPSPEERHLSMPETGEKERNYLFKSYTDLE